MTAPRIPAAHLQAIMDALAAIGAPAADVSATPEADGARLVLLLTCPGDMLALPQVLILDVDRMLCGYPIAVGHAVYMTLRQMRDAAAENPPHAFSL